MGTKIFAAGLLLGINAENILLRDIKYKLIILKNWYNIIEI